LTRYLLDTSIISDLIRNPQGKAAKRISKMGEDNICTSIIVAAKLRYGCAVETQDAACSRRGVGTHKSNQLDLVEVYSVLEVNRHGPKVESIPRPRFAKDWMSCRCTALRGGPKAVEHLRPTKTE
jgi:hypothetical protein